MYETIKPLFKNKPVIVFFNKCDAKKVEELSADKKAAIEEWVRSNELPTVEGSTLEGLNINEVKAKACESVMGLKQAIPEKYKLKSE